MWASVPTDILPCSRKFPTPIKNKNFFNFEACGGVRRLVFQPLLTGKNKPSRPVLDQSSMLFFPESRIPHRASILPLNNLAVCHTLPLRLAGEFGR